MDWVFLFERSSFTQQKLSNQLISKNFQEQLLNTLLLTTGRQAKKAKLKLNLKNKNQPRKKGIQVAARDVPI